MVQRKISHQTKRTSSRLKIKSNLLRNQTATKILSERIWNKLLIDKLERKLKPKERRKDKNWKHSGRSVSKKRKRDMPKLKLRERSNRKKLEKKLFSARLITICSFV